MLKISKMADYAIVIMSYLALKPDCRLSASEVARATHLSVPTVSKVLKLLQEFNLLSSERGSSGGYQLIRKAHEISVAEMITAVDGRPAITECGHGVNHCERESVCSLKGNWQLINQAVYAVLADLRLSDMLKPLSQPIHFHGLNLDRAHIKPVKQEH